MALATPFSIEDLPDAIVASSADQSSIVGAFIITWASVIVVIELALFAMFYLKAFRKHVFRRDVSRLFLTHVMYHILVFGCLVWAGMAWVSTTTVIDCLRVGACPTPETVNYWTIIPFVVVGIIGLLGTLLRKKLVRIWNWIGLAALLGLGVWLAIGDDPMFLIPIALPAALSFAIAVSTPTMLRQSELAQSVAAPASPAPHVS